MHVSDILGQSKNKSFAGRVSDDANVIIGVASLMATGKHFSDSNGSFAELPPAKLVLKAYWVSACFHAGKAVGQAFSKASADPQKSNRAEVLNENDEVIAHTTVDIL